MCLRKEVGRGSVAGKALGGRPFHEGLASWEGMSQLDGLAFPPMGMAGLQQLGMPRAGDFKEEHKPRLRGERCHQRCSACLAQHLFSTLAMSPAFPL